MLLDNVKIFALGLVSPIRCSLKAITLEQRRRMEELQDSVAKLMSTKDRQRQKLSNLKQELGFTNVEASTDKDRLKSQLDAVTGDLQSTKVAFEEITKREKQVSKEMT